MPAATETMVALPVREPAYFPHNIFPLFVGREKSVRAVEAARATTGRLLLLAQRDVSQEDPGAEDLYEVGTLAEVVQVMSLPEGSLRVMLEGLARVRVVQFYETEPLFEVQGEPLADDYEPSLEVEALARSVVTQFQAIVEADKEIPPEAAAQVAATEHPGILADTVIPYLHRRPGAERLQELLEMTSVRQRLETLNTLLDREFRILEIQRGIRSRVEKEMGDSQREFFLREQIKAIQAELGDTEEVDEFQLEREKIRAMGMPGEVAARALKEVDRLERTPLQSPEGTVIRNYLDWLTALPWSHRVEGELDIDAAERVLDEDHFGLARIKERILEFLAVRKLTDCARGPILCFAGPPGVGKTSIGRSIARALGRKFVRVSLGGVRDEAEIRGHRRTYVGSLPGRIIQGIKSAGSINPVFMLDEIDKLGTDFRGDPSAALLEALDPEQNDGFSDHYLEVPFDLSDVMFITTANLLDPIPSALRDRMEVIRFPGYTQEEKLAIASGFLLPKLLRSHGLEGRGVVVDEDALIAIIRDYTREAGVRNLERELAAVCRKLARGLTQGSAVPKLLDAPAVAGYLGPPRFRAGQLNAVHEIGAAAGLVFTEAGGDVLSVEAAVLKSSSLKLTLTGQLGDVMRESAFAALSYVRARARSLGIADGFFDGVEIHIHVPAGAVPKDGPSAGITLATALASALTQRPVRNDVALTGEITLRGKVLAVGGIKEKVLAARRAGVRCVILPRDNQADLEEIPEEVRRDLEFHLVDHMDQVLPASLVDEVKPSPAYASPAPGPA